MYCNRTRCNYYVIVHAATIIIVYASVVITTHKIVAKLCSVFLYSFIENQQAPMFVDLARNFDCGRSLRAWVASAQNWWQPFFVEPSMPSCRVIPAAFEQIKRRMHEYMQLPCVYSCAFRGYNQDSWCYNWSSRGYNWGSRGYNQRS